MQPTAFIGNEQLWRLIPHGLYRLRDTKRFPIFCHIFPENMSKPTVTKSVAAP